MLKELISTALMSFNIVNAQPTINKSNVSEQAILQYISLFQYEGGLSTPKLINQEQTTIKTYLNSVVQETFTNCITEAPFSSQDDNQIDLWAMAQPIKPFNKVVYEFDITILYNEWSGWTPTEQNIQQNGYIDNWTPVNTKSVIESNYISASSSKVVITQSILGSNNDLRTINGLSPISSNSTISFTKIKGGTNQENPEEPDIPITPDNPDGEVNVNYGEVIDIPGLIFTILTLPFTFIHNAFDLTIFKGTPYQLNFADIITLILGCMLLITIIRLIMSMKG